MSVDTGLGLLEVLGGASSLRVSSTAPTHTTSRARVELIGIQDRSKFPIILFQLGSKTCARVQTIITFPSV